MTAESSPCTSEEFWGDEELTESEQATVATIREARAIAGVRSSSPTLEATPDICNVNIDGLYPPALGSPGIFRLGGGQILNSEYAYHDRMNVHHTIGGDSHWSTHENPDGEWKNNA